MLGIRVRRPPFVVPTLDDDDPLDIVPPLDDNIPLVEYDVPPQQHRDDASFACLHRRLVMY